MDKVAVFNGSEQIYWYAIVTVGAIIAAAFVFFLLRTCQKCNYTGAVWVAALSIPMGVLSARAVYWFFRQEQYESAADIVKKASDGGYCLYGAVVGVIAAIIIVNRAGHFKSLPEMLDAAAPAAALGICIGRFASRFSSQDRGKVVESERFHRFPFTVYDSAQEQWCLSVFFFEAVVAGLIFIILTVLFVRVYIFDKEGRLRHGDIAMLLTLMYGCAQCVLESLRVDSLYFISLGFVRVSQVVSAVLVVAVLAVFSVRAVKRFGFKRKMAVLWAFCLALLGIAFYMELRLTSEIYVRNYTIMSICTLLLCVVGVSLYFLTDKNFGTEVRHEQQT